MVKVDRNTVLQILGSLMNNPEYLNDTDKYRIELTDFPTSLDKFIFSAISNLYNGGEGARNIRAIDIISYLKKNQIANNLLEKENGEAYIQDCEALGDPSNFNYYYQRIKKLNFLKDIQSTGRNIEKFYCEDILNPDYQKINEKFDRMSLNDILNELKLEISHYENKFVLKNQVEETNAFDGIRDLIKDLKVKPEAGCKLQGEIFNTICRGGRKGKLYLRSAASGVNSSPNISFPFY